MTYLRVEWIHNFEGEPVEMLSELDTHRNEVRKVERFRDGSLSFAGPQGASGSTMLSETPLPDAQDIASDPQFHVGKIDQDEFEHCWNAATIAVAA
jgi:hypothetical protein